MYESVYQGFLLFCMVVIGILLMICLIRAIMGPRITDRVIAVNMIGTMTIVEIAILALYMHETYLYDVCLIYAMISFLAVVVLTKVYQGAYHEKKLKGNLDRQEEDVPDEIEQINADLNKKKEEEEN
ncbi:MAG: monovalent cation/H+ antiporter complex subunit F [Lachnospiraceae bacterium]|nr:monovalent cation/H+ antiporter complex subunit F [Lachnospiraceae bacterium]